MRAVLQRVHRARVLADGKETGSIDRGLLIFLGIEHRDTNEDLEWLVGKLLKIRCFGDDEGRMNRNVMEVDGGLMVISQFTLFGTLKKGSRPSFNRSANPEQAIPLYEAFLKRLGELSEKPVAAGVFGAHMDILADNDGPVTLIIDTKDKGL